MDGRLSWLTYSRQFTTMWSPINHRSGAWQESPPGKKWRPNNWATPQTRYKKGIDWHTLPNGVKKQRKLFPLLPSCWPPTASTDPLWHHWAHVIFSWLSNSTGSTTHMQTTQWIHDDRKSPTNPFDFFPRQSNATRYEEKQSDAKGAVGMTVVSASPTCYCYII